MKNIYPSLSLKDIQPDTKNTYMSMRGTIAYHAPTDIEESAPLMLSAFSMTSPAILAHKYVIQRAFMPKPQGRD